MSFCQSEPRRQLIGFAVPIRTTETEIGMAC